MDHRRSSLLFHLGQAHSKITSLEDYIREREKQFRTVVHRFERTDSRSLMGGSRLRRVGLSHNLLHMRTTSQEEEEQDEADAYSKPLAEYAQLKITRVTDSEDEATPFSLCRVVSREYHVGEEGTVIGSGLECGISLPLEAGLEDKHVQIKWVPAQPAEGGAQLTERRGSRLTRQEKVGPDGKHRGHFEICDLTKGRGIFFVSHEPVTLQHLTIREDESSEDGGPKVLDSSNQATSDSDNTTPSATALPTDNLNKGKQAKPEKHTIPVHYGIKFVAGKLEFSFTALPTELLYTLRMFAAAKKGDLDELTNIIEASKSSDLAVPYISVSQTDNTNVNRFSTISVTSNQGADVNTEYQAPTYSDDAFFGPAFSRRRSSVHAVRNVTLLSPISPAVSGGTGSPGAGAAAVCSMEDHKLLLHIAIEKNHLEMVAYLISQNADVNQCVGELNRNALHLAAQKNLSDIMLELLRAGGDVEIRDALHQQPLALTSDYHVRKLLVNTVLLCAAAEEGDLEEVVRLLSSSHVSPNARGLRHKCALHLAAAKGHKQVVEFLLLNGAHVNAKGGSRLRTPLHYASLHDHVEVAVVLLEAGASEFTRDSGGYTPLNLSMGGKMCKLLHKEPLSLCLAVQSGDVESVKRLLSVLEVGGEEGDTERAVDQRNEQSHAPLHLACTSGHVEMVRVLVAHGASIGLRGGSDSWTPLMYAAMAGHGPVVEFLLSVGADSQEVDERGCSAGERVEQALEETKELMRQLESKIRAGNQSLVDTSLHTLEPASMLRQESGSSFSYEAERGWLKNRYDKLKKTLDVLTSGPDRLLKCIDTKNHTDFVELLKSGVVSANAMVDKHSPSSALVRVCENGLCKFAKTLIEYSAQVNQFGPADQIPLLVAAANGNVDLVKLLHESNADINVQSEDSLNTPLHEAATANSAGCVAYLLSVGARQDVCNISGETPFDCSTVLEVKKMLAVGPNKLLLAASIGDVQQIEQLIDGEGLSPSHVYPHGVTALHEACEAGQVDAVRLFIDKGADVNKQVHATMVTPLHLASQNNHIEIAKLLISGGAKMDLKDMDGKVPFEVACSNQMRKVLVEARTVHTQPVRREGSDTERRCMICMDNPINTIILPCGHEAFCTNCVSRISTCALDRQTIREVITVFK